jgi:hypothetical protein
MRLFIRVLVAGVLALTSAIAWSQGEVHPHHGGQAVRVGKYEIELTVKGADMTLYILDEKDDPVDSAGWSASAVVLARGNQQKTVELKPAGEHKLAGKVDFPVDGRFRATITLKNGPREVGKGRYNLNIGR